MWQGLPRPMALMGWVQGRHDVFPRHAEGTDVASDGYAVLCLVDVFFQQVSPVLFKVEAHD